MVAIRAKTRGETICSWTVQVNDFCSMASNSISRSGHIIMPAMAIAIKFIMKNLKVLSGVKMLFS